MSRIACVLGGLVSLVGCVESAASPDVSAPAARPAPLEWVGELPVLPIRCRYDPVQGVARVSLAEGEVGEGGGLWLYRDERPFAPTALDGLAGATLEVPEHRVGRAAGEPDLYLRVVATDEQGRVRAASRLCRLHSRAQLVARTPEGVVATDLAGVLSRQLRLPSPGVDAALDPLCGYPPRPTADQEAVLLVQAVDAEGRPGLVVASWERPAEPTAFGPAATDGGAALGDHQTAGGAAYAASPSGRFVAWLADDGAGLYVWDRTAGTPSPRRLTPRHLDVRRFSFHGEALVYAADHRLRVGGDCGIYRVDPESGESSRLHPGVTWPRCEHVVWWGDGALVAAVDPRTGAVSVLRPEGDRVERSVEGVDVAAGGSIRDLTWQHGGQAVAFRYREHLDARWRLGRLRLDGEGGWVERIPSDEHGDLLRFAVDPGGLRIAWVEAREGPGDGGGAVRIHVPGIPEALQRPVPQPSLTRLSWSPGGDFLLVSDHGGGPVVLDGRGDVVAVPEGGPQAPECWSWSPTFVTLNP